jgi:hypothetical protein
MRLRRSNHGRSLTRFFVFAFTIVAPLFVCSPFSRAGVIDIAGEPANWLVSGAGASNAVPLLTGDHLSITSNENETGTFIAGGSLANFDGFWEATETFFLPSDATDVSLSFAHFSSDDRALLELNGVVIGNSGNGAPGEGSFNFTNGGALAHYKPSISPTRSLELLRPGSISVGKTVW